MENNRGPVNRPNVTKKVKLCTINICGLSTRSKLALNHYIDAEKIDILSVLETGSDDLSKLELLNMSAICDTNKASNKGAALFVSNKYSITKLESISKLSRNLDSCWGLVVISKKRYIIGSVYVKLNYKPAITEVIRMLAAAEQKQDQLKASGIILTGDFNSRHLSWGDKVNNYYGSNLAELLDNTKYSVCTSETPTFLCANGDSLIDLSIISNNLAESVSSCQTDDEVELFSGAPIRGHVPLNTELIVSSEHISQPVVEKLDISKMQWEEWTKHIEDKIEEESNHLDSQADPYILWNHLNRIITEATDTYGKKKKCSSHNKPYWTESLSSLSKTLRAAKKNYIKRNTDPNLQKLKEAKENFDEERKIACQNFLINTAKQLNSTQAQQFWKDFNKLFKKKTTQKVDPLLDDNGRLLTENDKIDQSLFSVFFEAKHIVTGNFDDAFYHEINEIYDQIICEDHNVPAAHNDPHGVDDINRDITLSELIKAIKTSGKSTDNFNFHPAMFRHLGNKAMDSLLRLFNICLKNHKWVWDGAEVIFLRKAGKDSYSKPGSYRPICITSYIGKLLEAITARRIETLLLQTQQTDPTQEGFSAGKNTIRYLSRLHLNILADKEKMLTTLCLFIDFEKAFDSVWKKGLIVKLHKLGIQGNVIKLINNFLFTRKVTLNINGDRGNTRTSSEYGLPQGSVLSPVLFKIFISDFLTEFDNNPNIAVLKFADDASVKISGEDSPTCIQQLNHVLACVHTWSLKWRMKINCDRNKTEIIAFNSAEGNRDLIPETFKLGNKEIHRVTETKVLGLVIDEELTYTSHSHMVLKALYERWATFNKYSNKNWGFSTKVMLHLLKALFISKLSYASHIWITQQNTKEINKLWYHILKSTVGAVLNINQSIAEVILGIPPIPIQTKVNSIKHYLKINNTPVQNDAYKEFLSSTYNPNTLEPRIIHSKLREVFLFLNWKLKHHPTHFTSEDINIVRTKQYSKFNQLSAKVCTYSQNMMQLYIERELWGSSLKYQFQSDGYQVSPTPSCDLLPLPNNTTRKQEVQFMSLLYKNNLLNQSLWNLSKVPSPLCPHCNQEEETADHLLFSCNGVEEQLRTEAKHTYRMALKLSNGDMEPEPYIGILNATRDINFVKCCLAIVRELDIRVTFDL